MRKSLSLSVTTGAVIFIALATAIASVVFFMTPSYESIVKKSLGSDRVLLAQNGELLQTIRTDFSKRRLAWYGLDNFPEVLKESVIEAEDQRFWGHPGFDPIGLGRALWADIRGQRVQGASTLTMQLGDLIQTDVLLKGQGIEKGSLSRKLLQIIRAVLLEARWSKKEILEAYLNLIHLRGEFQGVPAFSQAYFNKHPLALDRFESALIATMISSPNQSAEKLEGRACLLLEKRLGWKGDCRTQIRGALSAMSKKNPSLPASPGVAFHMARRLFSEHPADSIVTSSLDAGLQKMVLGILERNMHRLKAENVHDTAALVIENKTGKVVAYVGTVSTSESPHVDGIQAYRQAGSSLKPFLYAKAIETKRLTAASILLDEPTAISWGGGVYRPANYDKHFSGPVSVREALGSSLNVPAVKTVTIIGLHPTYKLLQSLQLTKLREPDFYGVSMALGAVEVRLDELSNAYRMLANGGKWTPLQFTKIAAPEPVSASASVSVSVSASEKVLSPQSTFIISQILSDPNARSIGFGWDSPLETSFWTAVKTGTSKDYRDNWCVGFSERYTVGVWAGNFDATAMENVSGVSGVGPSWSEIMTALHRDIPSRNPVPPEGVVAKDIRHPWSSQSFKEYFIAGTEPTTEAIEASSGKNIQFVFPAEGSVLVRDPHLDPAHIELTIRFKGEAPTGSKLQWNGEDFAEAKSPVRVPAPKVGLHELSIVDTQNKVLTKIHFTIRGG